MNLPIPIYIFLPALFLTGHLLPAAELAPRPRSYARTATMQTLSAVKKIFVKSSSRYALPDTWVTSEASCRMTLRHFSVAPPPNGPDGFQRMINDPLQLAARSSQGFQGPVPLTGPFAEFLTEPYTLAYHAPELFALLAKAEGLSAKTQLATFLNRLIQMTVQIDTQIGMLAFGRKTAPSAADLPGRLAKSRDYDFTRTRFDLMEAWHAIPANLHAPTLDWLGHVYARQFAEDTGVLLHWFPEDFEKTQAEPRLNDHAWAWRVLELCGMPSPLVGGPR